MSLDKRQKKLERKAAKRKARQKQARQASQPQGRKAQLREAATWPVLECWINKTWKDPM